MTDHLATEPHPPMAFDECVVYCLRQPELVREFDRLNGTNLLLRGAPIELMIDKESGRTMDDFQQFIAFVYDCVWCRITSPAQTAPQTSAPSRAQPESA